MLGWSCYEAVAGSVVLSMVGGLVAKAGVDPIWSFGG